MRNRPERGKPVHVAFDGGWIMSDAGILLSAAIEQRLGVDDPAFKILLDIDDTEDRVDGRAADLAVQCLL
jgi:hypothetical protein